MTISKIEIVIEVGIALYGERWQTELARDLGFSDARRIRQWLTGDRSVPDSIPSKLKDLLVRRKNTIENCLININC